MFKIQVLDFGRVQRVLCLLRTNMKCLRDATRTTVIDSGDRVWMCWYQEASLEAEVRAMLRMCQGTGSRSWDAI